MRWNVTKVAILIYWDNHPQNGQFDPHNADHPWNLVLPHFETTHFTARLQCERSGPGCTRTQDNAESNQSKSQPETTQAATRAA